jgi:mono/diheme cytochrome c family protein/uncharacterized membrane protein
MLSHRSAPALGVRAGVVVLLACTGRPLAPAAIHAQADSSESVQHVAAALPARLAVATAAQRALYRQHCVKCHGADGKGSTARGLFPEIPDFTKGTWQRGRSNAQLLVSILDGKGSGMPTLRGKINKSQANDLVKYVRTFSPAERKAANDRNGKPASDEFDVRYRLLQQEMSDLQRQFHELSKSSLDKKESAPAASPPSRPARPAEVSPPQPPSKPVKPAAAEAQPAGALFRQRCVKCHGADGSGNRARYRQSDIPDFTDPAWQARRSDAQLLASILEGKRRKMPPWRGKLSPEQARGLVAEVRAFASNAKLSADETMQVFPPSPPSECGEEGTTSPTRKRGNEPRPLPSIPPLRSGEGGEAEESTSSEPGEEGPAVSFAEKLIGWLGRFHPATVHFPIAMLTAAAVAELLRLLTRQPVFDAITRYCLWFGALTAVAAGALGWFLGEFHLIDASWLLTAHRWLGTSTLVSAVLLLGLSEWRRRPERGGGRIWLRTALLIVTGLVLATGFFGGAVVYGLDHYAWQQ